jgi:hypothetical protein
MEFKMSKARYIMLIPIDTGFAADNHVQALPRQWLHVIVCGKS